MFLGLLLMSEMVRWCEERMFLFVAKSWIYIYFAKLMLRKMTITGIYQVKILERKEIDKFDPQVFFLARRIVFCSSCHPPSSPLELKLPTLSPLRSARFKRDLRLWNQTRTGFHKSRLYLLYTLCRMGPADGRMGASRAAEIAWANESCLCPYQWQTRWCVIYT